MNETQLSKKDFERVNWQEVISVCDSKECSCYRQKFLSQMDKEEYVEDINGKAVFETLYFLTMPNLNHNDNSPYVLTNYFDRISDSNLEVLKELIPDVSDDEMKARIADLVWNKKEDYPYAIVAINSYIESAKVLDDPKRWTPSFRRIKRAVDLAASLGKNNDHLNKALCYAESVLDKYDGKDPKFLSVELLNLLRERKHGDIDTYISISEKVAIFAESEHEWRKARLAWYTKANWHRLAKDAVEERNAKLKAVEMYVKNADDDMKKTPPDYANAVGRIEDAIQELRQVGSASSRIDELHALLLEYQKGLPSQMAQIKSEFSIPEEQNRAAREFVQGKTKLEAICSLASITTSPAKSKLEDAGETDSGNLISQIIGKTIVNSEGKTTGKSGSIVSDNGMEKEKAIKANMFKKARFYHLPLVLGILEPARIQINEEHDTIQPEDLLSIVSDNPFVPEGRENIYALGLYFGLKGDFLTSIHLLIPQLENSIRFVLRNNGIITSGIDHYGIQNEYDINTTLVMPELMSIIPEDIVFDLRGLLIEGKSGGSNLRNAMAHGLIDYDKYISSTEVKYVWWLILNLCYLWKTSSVITETETTEH
ncbi:MAG: DUF4209 domain-containing protein [Methanococcoides sp.]|nr:DUF4209 domain-containing protein [Methanococcoides sp.]